MTQPINPSEVMSQIVILGEALEFQKIALPSIETDLKCTAEMKKLLDLVERVEPIGTIELGTIHDMLESSKTSYRDGLERIRKTYLSAEGLSSEEIQQNSQDEWVSSDLYFPDTLWEVGEVARRRLEDVSHPVVVLRKLEAWIEANNHDYENGDDSDDEENYGNALVCTKYRILECLENRDPTLDLSFLGLKTPLPEIFNEKIFRERLEILNLSSNAEFEILPESIGDLRALEELYLSECNMESLPESICNLSNLRILTITQGDLSIIPENIGRLASLKELTIVDVQIAVLPESTGDLENLESLDLSDNIIERLPDSIGRLVHLKELDLSQNELSSLPESLSALRELKKLDVSCNRNLTGVPMQSCSYRALA